MWLCWNHVKTTVKGELLLWLFLSEYLSSSSIPLQWITLHQMTPWAIVTSWTHLGQPQTQTSSKHHSHIKTLQVPCTLGQTSDLTPFQKTLLIVLAKSSSFAFTIWHTLIYLPSCCVARMRLCSPRRSRDCCWVQVSSNSCMLTPQMLTCSWGGGKLYITTYNTCIYPRTHAWCYKHGTDSYIMITWHVGQACLFSFNLLNLATPL